MRAPDGRSRASGIIRASSFPPRPFFRLCCQEPFRIFFPLGALIGISGVSLWPLYFKGLHKFYPGVMHARMMSEGFMTCLVIGFLGAAAPRLTGAPHLSRIELRSLLALLVGAVGMQIAERPVVGDSIYLVLLLVFTAWMASRFPRRGEPPPAGLALVAFGFLKAIIGVALLLAGAAGDGFPRCALLGMLLLYQGFLLDLMMGVATFYLSRFGAFFAKSELPGTLWKCRVSFESSAGAVMLASFLIEVFAESPRLAGGIRLLTVAFFLAAHIPSHRSVVQSATPARILALALVFLLLGLLFPILWPWQRLAGEHLIFIGAFTLIAFTIAARVMLRPTVPALRDHSDFVISQSPATLLIIAAILRAGGDFLPALRGALLSAAAYLWMLSAGMWIWLMMRTLRGATEAMGPPDPP